jgi:hypothetical protein
VDEVAVRKLIVQFRLFTEQLPREGDIEKESVGDYNALLTSFQGETVLDLAPFMIPPEEIEVRLQTPGTPAQYWEACDGATFRLALLGAENAINSMKRD